MSRFCKSCAFLNRYTYASSGKASDPHDSYAYACTWAASAVVPWAEGLLRGRLSVQGNACGIAKRHVEGDWSEAMDCPTWRAIGGAE